MKYPVFAFVTGGLFVEFVHVAEAGNREIALLIGAVLVGLTVIGSVFEAAWNFK